MGRRSQTLRLAMAAVMAASASAWAQHRPGPQTEPHCEPHGHASAQGDRCVCEGGYREAYEQALDVYRCVAAGRPATSRRRGGAPLVADAGAAPAEAPIAAEPVAPPASAPRGCPDGALLVPAASFMMGAADADSPDNERPAHAVRLSGYCIDRTEVTVRAWRACVAAGRCPPAPNTVDAASARSADDAAFWSRLCNGGRSDRDDHPVNCVDWAQASAYCRWSGGRLPTEAEWEHAARGDDGRRYPWGSGAPVARILNASRAEAQRFMTSLGAPSWQTLDGDDDGWPATAPVGSFPGGASSVGALDMAGNVSEWVADGYARYPDGAAGDAPRVIRGGSWGDHDAAVFRATARDQRAPTQRASTLGFRCARNP